MTNQETIANLNMIRVGFVDPATKEQMKLIYDTFDNAIQALEQEPCEDAISRQAVLNACEQSINILEAVDRIMDLPSVEQEPKTGHWIDTGSESFEFHRVYKCSECGNTEIEYPEGIRGHFRYCPNCGARMESEDKG